MEALEVIAMIEACNKWPVKSTNRITSITKTRTRFRINISKETRLCHVKSEVIASMGTTNKATPRDHQALINSSPNSFNASQRKTTNSKSLSADNPELNKEIPMVKTND